MKTFAGDIIILHMCTKNYNHAMYCSWDMECGRQNFLSLWTIFCPFKPPPLPFLFLPMDPENQNFEKTKNKLEDVIIFGSHMNMVFQIWSATDKIFCHSGPFSALTNNPKNQNFEKMKKTMPNFHREIVYT